MPAVDDDFGQRNQWLARHVLPREGALRAAIARWRLPDGVDADDIVQEVFGNLAEVDDHAAIRNVGAYMRGIARNIVLAYWRRSRVVSIQAVEDLEQLAIPSDEAWVDEQVSDRQQLHRLALAVGELEEPGRSIFLLRFVEEMTQREIADRLSISEDRVQRSLVAMLVDLAALLGRRGKRPRRASHRGTAVLAGEGDGTARVERRD